jgi:hypothetical protein
MVHPQGFEPVSPAFGVRCSNLGTWEKWTAQCCRQPAVSLGFTARRPMRVIEGPKRMNETVQAAVTALLVLATLALADAVAVLLD